jgi:HK97 family phage major capsid protein
MDFNNQSPATLPGEQEGDILARTDRFVEIGQRFGAVELAREFALAGKSERELLAAIQESRIANHKATPPVTLTETEHKRYSLTRAIGALLQARHGRRENSFEWEVSDTIDRALDDQERAHNVTLERRGGLLIPTTLKVFAQPIRRRYVSPELRQLMQRAGLDTGTAGKGPEVVFTEEGSFIDFLYNRALVMQLGATVLTGLVGNVAMPKQSGTATASWVAENPVSGVADSELSLAQVTLSPKTLMARTFTTRQLLRQSSPDINALMQADLARVIGLKLDNTAIHGAGTGNDFKGIYKLTGVNSVAFGGPPTYDKIVDLETAIAEDNADFAQMAYVTTPGIRGKAKKTQKFSGTNGEALWDMGEMNGYRAEATNQVSKVMLGTDETGGAAHGLVFGVWPSLVFGEWGALELIADEVTQAAKALVYVTAFMMADMDARYDEAFAVGTGVTTS